MGSDLTIQQVATVKGVSSKTVRRWIAAGLLPAYRVGPRLIRIRAADVEALGRLIPSAAAGRTNHRGSTW